MTQGWALLPAVVLYLAGGVREQLSIPETKNYIYGNIGHPVKIYVKMHQNSPLLTCMDMELSQTEIVDPISLWIGPNGKHLRGYREPNYVYQMTVRFTTESCTGKKNSQFFKLLMRILDKIISDLSCHIEEKSYKCHFLEIPKYGLKDELFIAFQVKPFPQEWKATCRKLSVDSEEITNSKVHQARDRIEEFFLKQTDILKHEFNYIPNIHYVDHSFKVIRIDSCQPGFGKNDILHSDCASCCVVCDPRTYSPDTDVTCQACLTVHDYGAKTCP
ncbi:zona pellucida-binding protein 2 isoform X4 [Macrotis lagotis]|uniref:zona pellucida-binding protein 2 isoform X4 n=1 Tax=Macrotis lagotis TaxID=92651 RepID=UPI003D69A3F2